MFAQITRELSNERGIKDRAFGWHSQCALATKEREGREGEEPVCNYETSLSFSRSYFAFKWEIVIVHQLDKKQLQWIELQFCANERALLKRKEEINSLKKTSILQVRHNFCTNEPWKGNLRGRTCSKNRKWIFPRPKCSLHRVNEREQVRGRFFSRKSYLRPKGARSDAATSTGRLDANSVARIGGRMSFLAKNYYTLGKYTVRIALGKETGRVL